jgi:hypothetical protein
LKNGYVNSLNGKLRADLLNGEILYTVVGLRLFNRALGRMLQPSPPAPPDGARSDICRISLR